MTYYSVRTEPKKDIRIYHRLTKDEVKQVIHRYGFDVHMVVNWPCLTELDETAYREIFLDS